MQEEDDVDAPRVLLVQRVPEPHLGIGVFGKGEEYTKVRIRTQFHLGFESLSELARFNAHPSVLQINWMRPAVGALLLLLMVSVSLLVHIRGAFLTAQRYGYILLSEAFFQAVVDARIREVSTLVQPIVPGMALPTNALELLALLEQSNGSAWPLRAGPPVRRMQDHLCIDLFAATMQLERLLSSFPKDGAPADARGKHFELPVQNLIDASPWRPPDHLRRIRGRHLTHPSRGKARFTEIDAIGAKEDTLLIVSCKSIPYSEAYDAGDFKAVRSAKSTIETAVKDWAKIKQFFEEYPTSRGQYDFSAFRHILAVVCTPTVFYVSLGPATQFIAPGLRAAVSFQELQTWLQEGDAPGKQGTREQQI